jgi:hypothetical protein
LLAIDSILDPFAIAVLPIRDDSEMISRGTADRLTATACTSDALAARYESHAGILNIPGVALQLIEHGVRY